MRVNDCCLLAAEPVGINAPNRSRSRDFAPAPDPGYDSRRMISFLPLSNVPRHHIVWWPSVQHDGLLDGL